MVNDSQILTFVPSGDSAFIIKAGDNISIETNRIIRKLLLRIDKENLDGIIDLIPSYNELMICYDPQKIGFRRLLDALKSLSKEIEPIELPLSSIIHVPVVYGDEFGLDLSEVAVYNGLTNEEVVRIHFSVDYLVYMLGFTPGFCYLGGMDERIATPRKKTPRTKIPAGAVGIADKQTGIYPIESPGGWQLIGITPLKLFDPNRKPEFLIQAGDYIRFSPISKNEFHSVQLQVASGEYTLIKEAHK